MFTRHLVCSCVSGVHFWVHEHKAWRCSLTLTLDHGPKCLHKGNSAEKDQDRKTELKGLQGIPDTLIILDCPKCSFEFSITSYKPLMSLLAKPIKACKIKPDSPGLQNNSPSRWAEWVKGSGRVDRVSPSLGAEPGVRLGWPSHG